jgi:hypothetical protein
MADGRRREDLVVRVNVVVKNNRKRSVRLSIDLDGCYYEMGDGVALEVCGRGPAIGVGTLTVEMVEDGVNVRGWPGCVLSVHPLAPLGASPLPGLLPVAGGPRRHDPPQRRDGDDDIG